MATKSRDILMQRRSPHSSLPSSPLVLPVPLQPLPLLAPLESHTPLRRLLVPTVRYTRITPRLQRTRTAKITRQSRSGSISAEIHSKDANEWVSALGKLHIVEDQLELRGFQLYAVEKWVVDRSRLINVVSVYTGDPNHKITVTALAPYSALSDVQAQAEFDNALHILRREGARPRETEHGVLLITSLANFRSDYNLVLIPNGNFLTAREQLYVNINLLRMGCSGRTALTLQEPSEPTKDRYLSIYCFSDVLSSGMSFNHCVLELVKLVQSALALFGMFDSSPEERNGLLCDVTAEGIQHWTDQVGEPLLSLEPMERVGDPSIVSALLSLVVTMRNKLHAIGMTQTPKDPFQDVMGFMHVVSTLHFQRSGTSALGYLTLETVEYIKTMYDRRSPEYRVPRMILGKLDEITTELNLRGAIDPAMSTAHVYATADLAGFVQMMVGAGNRDAVESLKALWTGKVLHRKKTKKDGAEDDERERTDGKSTEEEEGGQSIFPSWPRHMKIEGLKGFDFGLGRSKRPSMDLTKVRTQKLLHGDEAAASPASTSRLPTLVISGQAEHALSMGRVLTGLNRDSGEGSAPSANPSSFGLSPNVSARSSNVNLTSADPFKPRSGLPMRVPSRMSTVSDPLSSSREERRAFLRRASAYEGRGEGGDDGGEKDEELESERRANREVLLGATRRRHSIHSPSDVRERPRISVERMKIDVGLCGQYLIMCRRKLHLQNITALLQHLQTSLHAKTEHFQADMAANSASLAEVTRVRINVSSALDASRGRSAEWGSISDRLRYQIDEMNMAHFWQNVRYQRARVLVARQRVFSTPPGTRPAPGTASRVFFRVQTTLDPSEQRLVDWAGRTESEAEEEAGMEGEEEWAKPLPCEELRGYMEATKVKRVKEPWWWWWWPRLFGRGEFDEDERAREAACARASAHSSVMVQSGESTPARATSPDDL